MKSQFKYWQNINIYSKKIGFLVNTKKDIRILQKTVIEFFKILLISLFLYFSAKILNQTLISS